MAFVGDASKFALDALIAKPSANPGLFGLGYFNILLNGRRYGVKKDDATYLACSVDAVASRLVERGKHRFDLIGGRKPEEIASAILGSIYEDSPTTREYFGVIDREFVRSVYNTGIMWAPDGDQAFDDGSFVIQADLGDRVRIIGFRNVKEHDGFIKSLAEVSLAADDFYNLLEQWLNLVKEERLRHLQLDG